MNFTEELQQDINLLSELIAQQGKLYSEPGNKMASMMEVEWPATSPKTPYGELLRMLGQGQDQEMAFATRVTVILALLPEIQPQVLDTLGAPDSKGRDFTEYGRFRNDFNSAFIPTVQTVLFLLAGRDIALRFRLQKLFLPDSSLIQLGVLQLESYGNNHDFINQRIKLSSRWVHKLTTAADYVPEFGTRFPATRIATKLNWDDLVLHPHTQEHVKELESWLEHKKTLQADPVLARRLKPGYRTLFYGPPGTGKTLTVSLIGKTANLPVYRVDLSLVVSKYIGETEKNLSRLFHEAAGQRWILFFDEADSLFGKRTQTQSAHDKYANQEVSYLLQKVEDHPGLVILASNFKSNIDDAFLRRFNSIIHFPFPGKSERLDLWKKTMPEKIPFASDINLEELARKYELTGAHIVNIIHSASIKCLASKSKQISKSILLWAIRKELEKEGKVMN